MEPNSKKLEDLHSKDIVPATLQALRDGTVDAATAAKVMMSRLQNPSVLSFRFWFPTDDDDND